MYLVVENYCKNAEKHQAECACHQGSGEHCEVNLAIEYTILLSCQQTDVNTIRVLYYSWPRIGFDNCG